MKIGEEIKIGKTNVASSRKKFNHDGLSLFEVSL